MIEYRGYKMRRDGDFILLEREGYIVKRVYTHSYKIAKIKIDKIIKAGDEK